MAVWLVVGVMLGFLSSLALAQPAKETKGKQPEKQVPVAGQQVCPVGQPVGKNVCQVQIECPAIQSPGKTVCQMTIDCPAPKTEKEPTKEKPKKKK